MSAAAVEIDSQGLDVLELTYTAVLWNPYRDFKILAVNRLMAPEESPKMAEVGLKKLTDEEFTP